MAEVKWSDDAAFPQATTINDADSAVGLQGGANTEYPFSLIKNYINAPVTVKVSLSSAEILSLSTVPKTLIAAPGAGKFINVLSVAFRLNFNSVAYATNTTLRLEIGSFNPIVGTNTIIASSTTDFIVCSPTQSLEVSGSPDWVNTLLRAKILTANPTAGNSTLDIYISYNILTL